MSAGSMSITALRQLLVEKLGERDAERFRDGQLQNLLDKEYKDEGALQDATRDGLGTPPPLPAALIDKILKAFGQPGEKLGMMRLQSKKEPQSEQGHLAIRCSSIIMSYTWQVNLFLSTLDSFCIGWLHPARLRSDVGSVRPVDSIASDRQVAEQLSMTWLQKEHFLEEATRKATIGAVEVILKRRNSQSPMSKTWVSN